MTERRIATLEEVPDQGFYMSDLTLKGRRAIKKIQKNPEKFICANVGNRD